MGKERETNWLLWIPWIFLFGWNKTVSELIFTAAKMCQLAGISKDTKIHNFLKDPFELHPQFL